MGIQGIQVQLNKTYIDEFGQKIKIVAQVEDFFLGQTEAIGVRSRRFLEFDQQGHSELGGKLIREFTEQLYVYFNLYRNPEGSLFTAGPHSSREQADKNKNHFSNRLSRIKITLKEGVYDE